MVENNPDLATIIKASYKPQREASADLENLGYKYDLTNQVLGNAELDDGTAITGGDATSIYAIKFGEPYVAGFYEFPLTTRDVGLLDIGLRTHRHIFSGRH